MTNPQKFQDPTSSSPLHITLSSVQKTLDFGTELGRQAEGGEVVAVTGELGAGKTTVARGMAIGLGTPPELVSSPTFTLIQEYPGRLTMVHVDLYRLNSEAEFETLGLHEHFGENRVIFVEWADRFPQVLPEDHLVISLVHQEEHSRTLSLWGTGPKSWKMVGRISQFAQAHF